MVDQSKMRLEDFKTSKELASEAGGLKASTSHRAEEKHKILEKISEDSLLESLLQRLEEYPKRLEEARKRGVKVIGYFCSFAPEEIIYAAGMIPIRLAFGGEADIMLAGEQFLKPYSCPYARSCLGYRAEGKNFYYKAVDAVCVAYTCDSMRRVHENWEHYFDVPSFAVGVPRTYDRLRVRPQATNYFVRELHHLRKDLEQFGGVRITGRRLRKSIDLFNSIRREVRGLYESLKSDAPPISWEDTLRISHAGFILDRSEYLREVRKINRELQVKAREEKGETKGPRLMIYGSMMAIGDHKVLDIIRQAGGNIVADAFCSGSRFWRKDVAVGLWTRDPIEALAERYLYNIPCPHTTDLAARLDHVTTVAREYRAKGLIYYNLKYCETVRSELKFFEDALKKELNIPTLFIETEYSPSDIGTIRTKVEAFLEMIRGA